MPQRRGQQQTNAATVADGGHGQGLQPGPQQLGIGAAPGVNSSTFPTTSRSASPSAFTQFLARPSKWFGRSASQPKLNPATAAEPRSSTSSARKHKISRPTDPRPLLDVYNGGGHGAARSVVDLSSTRPPNSLDLHSSNQFGQPPGPVTHSTSAGPTSTLGDLRAISRKTWSKSADDLSSINLSHYSPNNTGFQEKVAEYRMRSNSNASVAAASPTSISSGEQQQMIKGTLTPGGNPFPNVRQHLPPPPPKTPPAQSATPAVTISPPSHGDDAPAAKAHVHIRSHSFTPKLSAKLGLLPMSPKRKASAGSEAAEMPMPPSTRGFGFGFGTGSNTKETTPTIVIGPPLPVANPPPPALLTPFPTDATSSNEPSADEGSGLDSSDLSKRSSQIVLHSSFINRLGTEIPHAHPATNAGLGNSKAWKPFKLELKGSKLYFYKPPSDRVNGVKELFSTEVFPDSPDEMAPELDEVPIVDIAGPSADAGGAEEWEATVGRARKGSRDDVGGTGGGIGPGSLGRKKRAYWGRGRHPDLVLVSTPSSSMAEEPPYPQIERGTFEALIHEAVFATTFEVPSPSSPISPSFSNVIATSDEIAPESEGKPAMKVKPATPTEADMEKKIEREQRYLDFASSVFLCLPALSGPGLGPVSNQKQKFETEFLRCAQYLVSGSSSSTSPIAFSFPNRGEVDAEGEEETEQELMKQRVAWLAAEYLRYHGPPCDVKAWEEFRTETVPDAPGLLVKEGDVVSESLSMNLPTSSSMQAMYVPTPLGTPVPGASGTPTLGTPSMGSPMVGLFSPRPETSKRVSIFGTLEKEVPPSPRPVKVNGAGTNGVHSLNPSNTLSGIQVFNADTLRNVDPSLIARSLTLFHRGCLEQTPDNLSASYLLDPVPPTNEMGLKPFLGTDENPHWLTRLVLVQLYGGDSAPAPNSALPHSPSMPLPTSPSSPGILSSPSSNAVNPRKPQQDPNGIHVNQQRSPPPPLHAILSKWIQIGENCRLSGDECSWRAICAAVTSPAVARMEKAWSRIEPSISLLVRSWVRAVCSVEAHADGDSEQGIKERITPWGGDIILQLKDELAKARGDSDEASSPSVATKLFVDPLENGRKLFESFRTNYELCPRKFGVTLGEKDGEVGEDLRRLALHWRESFYNERGPLLGPLSQLKRLDDFMAPSLAIEPRRKGLFEPHFWSRPSPTSAPQASLLPVLFPEPMPSLAWIDRSQILRGRVESDLSDVPRLRAVQGQLRADDSHLGKRISGFAPRGTVIPVYNGDLLLVVQSTAGTDSTPSSRPTSRVPSRPPSSIVDQAMNDTGSRPVSRTPSIRVKPGSSQTLDRKTSMARRNSLPSLSNPRAFAISEPSSEPPIRVLVQGGTLNALVEILVHDLVNVSVSVADDNGEMSLKERTPRELKLDHREFAIVWWSVFRSFVTPLVLFELLRKMYIKQNPLPTSIGDYISLINGRSEVLETLKEWVSIGGGAQDILDDKDLFQAVQVFLNSPTDHTVHQNRNFFDPTVQNAWQNLVDCRQTLRAVVKSATMRPPAPHKSAAQTKATAVLNETRLRNFKSTSLPDIDRASPADLVDSFEGMACAAFGNVSEEDLFITSDLLEVQTADRTGWFVVKEPMTNEEVVEIQNICTHVHDVEVSSLVSELNQDALYRILPPGVRGCVRAFSILRKWIISKLVAPRLGLRTRQSRMETFLRVIEIARFRSMEASQEPPTIEHPCVRSFVEAVVTSAIISPESRIHQRAWQNVAFNRGTQCDSLTALLARPSSAQNNPASDPLTMDIGWLLERLLDLISTPDVLESSHDGESLVHFDKRRHLFSLITNTPNPPPSRRAAQQAEFNRCAFSRLNALEKDVYAMQFDHRGIKEEAQKEAVTVGIPGSAKKMPRPFQRLVSIQIEKIRRDRNLRSRMHKEKIQEQAKNEKREEVLNRAMRPRKPPTTAAQKQHRNKKSMSAFLSFMRPISSAFVSDNLAQSGRRSPADLDFTPTGKPSLVLSLVEARVAQFINNERPFTFQLDTEDDGHYLLQAVNKKDMNKWIETISRVTNIAAKRRLTYIGSPKPQLSDHIQSHPLSPSRDPRAVFSVELQYLLRREAGGQEPEPGTIPSVIEACLQEIESRGLTEVGIYRIAGAATEINGLKEAFNRGESPITESTDIHAVCDLVKTWFREMPEPTFPSSSYHNVIEAMKLENLDDRLAAIRSVIHGLPQANFDLLKRVAGHLDKVSDFEESNQMTVEALAIVFSPNLLRAPQHDFVLILSNLGHTHKLVRALITHFHVLFDDVDGEQDLEQEFDELDSQILEESEVDDDDDDRDSVAETAEAFPAPQNLAL